MNITDSELHALRQGLLDEAAQHALLERALAQHRTEASAAHADHVFEIADQLAYAQMQAGRFEEAIDTANTALACGQDAALLHTLALCEHARGEHAAAKTHLEQALTQLGETLDDERATLRADMLQSLAHIQQRLGQNLRALSTLEQAATLFAQHNDVANYVQAKRQLAAWVQGMGDAVQAADHWMDVLSHVRQLGLHAQSAQALLQLAELAQQSNNPSMEFSLRREAIEPLARAGMTHELTRTLFQIARGENQRDLMWQAVWLMLTHTRHVEGLINAHAWLYMREEQKTERDAALLAAATWATIESLPDEQIAADAALQARSKRLALTQLFTCARLQGVHETEIKRWMEEEKLRLEDQVIQRTIHHIESMPLTSGWLFDRNLLTKN